MAALDLSRSDAALLAMAVSNLLADIAEARRLAGGRSDVETRRVEARLRYLLQQLPVVPV